MEIVKIIGVGIVGAMAALIVKEYKPSLAIPVSIITAVILFLMVLSQIGYVFGVINQIAAKLNINTEYILTIIRIIGVAYLSQFGSEVCRDAGQNAVAAKVELAGKVLIVVTLMNLLIGLLPD